MNILLTAIGGDISQSISKILRELENTERIVGTDVEIDHPGRFYADNIFRIPKADSKEFIPTLLELINKENIDYVIPVNEKEIIALVTYLNDNLGNNLLRKFIIPSTHKYEMLFNKIKSYELIKSQNKEISLPWTIDSVEFPISFPCIYKKKESSGSKSFKKITREEYLKNKNEYFDGIFQEYLYPEDEEYTCGVYRSIKTKVIYVIVLKRKLKGGLTGFAEVVEDKEITSYCESIAESIELQGSINIQLIKTINGPRLLEINPRFSSTVYFRHKVGFKDLLWSLKEREILNYKIRYDEKIAIGKKFYRVYTEIIE